MSKKYMTERDETLLVIVRMKETNLKDSQTKRMSEISFCSMFINKGNVKVFSELYTYIFHRVTFGQFYRLLINYPIVI